LTPEIRDLVPAAYKFLSGDTLTGADTYTVQIERRETTWQYIVNKKYKSNSITLEGLKISGDVAFNKSLPDGKAIFKSTDAVPLQETPKKITLQHNDKKICDLPNPTLKTPLNEKEPGSNRFESHIFIYV
jgi:hypothetical protein